MIPKYLKGCPRKRDDFISFPTAELRLFTGNSRDPEFGVMPAHDCSDAVGLRRSGTLLGWKTGSPQGCSEDSASNV